MLTPRVDGCLGEERHLLVNRRILQLGTLSICHSNAYPVTGDAAVRQR